MPNIESTQIDETTARGSDAVLAASLLRDVAPDWHAWYAQCRQHFEDALSTHLKALESSAASHSRLTEAVVYSVRAGGKRLRPVLVLESCRVCGGKAATAMPAALAMEFVHTFSLIHDDLPAMDDDDLRRGQPTCHKVYGDALAILAGDWLAAHAMKLLASVPTEPAVVGGLLQALGQGTLSMIEGQAADIESEGLPADGERVQYIHANKTAALIEACCRLGALCGGAASEVSTALARYGRRLGLAFQIVDDLLDARGDESHLGKRVGKDADAGKQTYPAAHGIEASEARAQQEAEAALAALESFGGRADRLRDLARFVIRRDR